MSNKLTIIVICGQSLKNIKGATRAYNMYKALERAGVKVTYLDGWKPAIKFKYRNIRNWLRLIIFSLLHKKRGTIFIENVMNPLYLKIINRFGIPIVIDVRDDLNLHADEMGLSTSYKLKVQRDLSNIENFELAENIIIQSESYKEYYIKKYKIEENKFIIVLNSSDINHFNISKTPLNPTIGLIGGMNKGQGFELLLKSAKICKKEIPALQVKCAYDYIPQTKQHRDYIREKFNEPWIEFLEEISYSTNVDHFFSSLNLSVIPLENTISSNMKIPTKLFDSMAAGRPLIVTNIKETAKIIEDEQCGFVCDFTADDMAEKILILLKDRKLAQEMGLKGRKAAEERHNWDLRVKIIIAKLQNSRI